MIYRFYNHTPFVLAASPDVAEITEDKDEATEQAAAAIFLMLYEECDPRIYRHLKRFMEDASQATNAIQYRNEIRKIAEGVKEGEL